MGFVCTMCFAKYEPAPAKVIETVSPDSSVVAQAFPRRGSSAGRIIVSRHKDDKLVKLWSLRTYSEWIRVSNGGDVLAIIVWKALKRGNPAELFLEFYRRGKLVAQHRIGDLYRNKDIFKDLEFLTDLSGPRALVAVSASSPIGFGASFDFHFVTGDKLAYDFDGATGKIIRVALDEAARSLNDTRGSRSNQ